MRLPRPATTVLAAALLALLAGCGDGGDDTTTTPADFAISVDHADGSVPPPHHAVWRLEVDDAPCIAYPRLTGDVEVGDVVLVNEQAKQLGLGSGGFDVLYANLTRGLRLPVEEGAHVMALPYTPGQHATRFAEEDEDGDRARERIDGVPVVCLGLHSQLAPACAAERRES